MKAIGNRIDPACRPDLEADLEAIVRKLFLARPALRGFSVQDAATVPSDRAACHLEGDLCLADVTVHPAPDADAQLEHGSEIGMALLSLIDERPQARELLRGRTFARTLN